MTFKGFIVFSLLLLVLIVSGYAQDEYKSDGKIHAEIEDLRDSIKVAKNDSIRIRYLARIGHRYMRLDDPIRALQAYQQGLQASIEVKHKWGIADGYSNVNRVFQHQKNWAKSEESLISALEIFRELGDSMQVAQTYNNLGSIYFFGGQLDKSLLVLRRALEMKRKDASKNSLSNTLSLISRVHRTRKNFPLAIQGFEESLKLRQESGIPDQIAGAYMNLAGVYFDLKDYSSAIWNVNEALKIVIKSGDLDVQISCYEGLRMFYEAKGDFENAYLNQSTFHRLRDSISSGKSKAQLNQLMIEYDTEKKERELVQMELEQEQDEKALSEADALLNLLILGIISLLIIAGIIVLFIIQKNKTQREVARQKAEKNAQKLKTDLQLEAMNALIKGQESERKRIAQDLHDGLGGLLATLRVRLPQNKDAPSEEAETSELVDEVCTEVRRIAHNMMPEVLLKFGLVAAIEDLARKVRGSGKLEIQVQSFGMEENKSWDENFELPVYRIVQELVSNVLKHAAATELLIQLNQASSNLNIIVEDNGKGFDPQKVAQKKSLGMQSLRLRVQYLKGTFNIDSRPGNGTSVMIDLPLNPV